MLRYGILCRWLIMAGVVPALSARADRDGGDRMLMRMAVILECEERARNGVDAMQRKTAEAMIGVLFRELASDFHPEDMREYVLVRVGDYFRKKTSTPRKSLVYYNELLGREDRMYRQRVLWARAEVYEASSDAGDLAKAIEDYDHIVRETEDPARRDLAMFRKIDVWMKAREYAKAAAEVESHLHHDQAGFGKYRPGADLLHALSFDRRDMVDEAIVRYSKVFSAHMGNVPVSTIALTRWMELTWHRNQPGDRQAAYEAGVQFIGLTPRFKEKLTADEAGLWEDVKRRVKVYEADPGIRKILGMEEIPRSME